MIIHQEKIFKYTLIISLNKHENKKDMRGLFMKQFTFLQEGSNRFLSKVQKSLWSCTHVNSNSEFTLHINLHILLMILIKA